MVNHELISVIVVTRNREKLLLRCLAHIDRQDYAHREVLVIDDNSKRELSPLLEAEFPQARLCRNESHKGLIYSRDKGARLANGQILFFIDDDAVIEDANVLSKGMRIFEDTPDIACISLRISDYVYRDYSNTPFSKRDKNRRARMFERFDVSGFLGTAHFLRRKGFLDSGGYLDMQMFGGEETDLSHRLLKRGYRICYAGDLVAYHGPATEGLDHSEDELRYRSKFCNSFIIAARYLPFPYFLTSVSLWTAFYLYRYSRHRMLSSFARDFWYAIRNFTRVWRSERYKYILDHGTVDRIKALDGRLW